MVTKRSRTAPDANGRVHVLTREEAYEAFDQAARRYLNISGNEFLRAWHAGEFDADPDRPAVMHVAMLLPLAE